MPRRLDYVDCLAVCRIAGAGGPRDPVWFNDLVIPSLHAEAAAQRLRSLGVEVKLDIVPGLGHGINAEEVSACWRS